MVDVGLFIDYVIIVLLIVLIFFFVNVSIGGVVFFEINVIKVVWNRMSVFFLVVLDVC